MRYIIIIGGAIEGDGAHEDPAFLCHKWFDGPMPDSQALTTQIYAMLAEWEVTDIYNVGPAVVWPPNGSPFIQGDGLSLKVIISEG